jgi:hypothetical protein
MITPGSAYGTPSDLPEDAVVVSSDHEAASVLAEARSSGNALPQLVLRGGDLYRTLGGVSPDQTKDRTQPRIMVPVDLGIVRTDDHEFLFVAHAVFRSSLWHGRFEILMNAQWCGELDLGPRSHPGDGLLDITTGSLALRQRLQVRTRARSGSHLPHPSLSTRRASSHEVETGHRTAMFLDGVRRAPCSHASVHIEPDAFVVHI